MKPEMRIDPPPMLEIRESSNPVLGPLYLINPETNSIIVRGLCDREQAEEITRDLNAQKRFTPKTHPHRRCGDFQKQHGIALLELALVLPIICFLILGSIDWILAEVDAGDVSFLAQQAAICQAKPGCDPVGYTMSSAHGLALNPANLSVSPNANNTVTVSYTTTPIGPVFPSVTLTKTASAN